MMWSGVIFGTMAWMVPQILWLLGMLTGRCFGYRVPYAPFGWTALGLVLLVWLALAYGYFWGRFRVNVTEEEYVNRSLPAAFEGYRIVHVSDLHVDSFLGHEDKLQRVISTINAQHPDAILFTGDLTTVSSEAARTFEAMLASLHARDGVFSVLGNHDFFIYDRHLRTDRQRCAAADSLAGFEREVLGWTVLRNESVFLHRGGDSIAVAGVDNINGDQGFRTIQRGDLAKATQGLDGIFTILLSHDPSHWRAEVLPKSEVQLTLSGHTHAAQVRIFGYSPSRLLFGECDGRYEAQTAPTQPSRMLYVNAGIGCTAPFRIGCPSEVTVIRLRKG